jgi:hypothetical protein
MKNIPSFRDYLSESQTSDLQFDEIVQALPKLEQLIQREIGVKITLNAREVKGRHGTYLSIKSNDLTNQMGKLGGSLFNTSHVVLEGASKVMADDSVMFTINFMYTVPYGGSNGVKFIWDAVWYSFSESGWVAGRKIA